MFACFLFCFLPLSLLSFLWGTIPFWHIKEPQQDKPIPAEIIKRLFQLRGHLRQREGRSLTCFHELLSLPWPPSPCSSAPQHWCVSSLGLLSGTRSWTVCHQSEWAASQTSSFSSVPATQLNKGEATFIRRDPNHECRETFVQHQLVTVGIVGTYRQRGDQMEQRNSRVRAGPSATPSNIFNGILFFQSSGKCQMKTTFPHSIKYTTEIGF